MPMHVHHASMCAVCARALPCILLRVHVGTRGIIIWSLLRLSQAGTCRVLDAGSSRSRSLQSCGPCWSVSLLVFPCRVTLAWAPSFSRTEQEQDAYWCFLHTVWNGTSTLLPSAFKRTVKHPGRG